MFDRLNEHFSNITQRLRGKKKILQGDIDDTLRDIRKALLEADCALETVNHITNMTRERASGQALISKDITADQQIIKIVNDCLIEILGGEEQGWEDKFYHRNKLTIIMMVGLQGSGKTTTSAKIAHLIKQKNEKPLKILMASCDIYRPAAQEQLAILADQIAVDSLEIIADQKPIDITKRAIDHAKKQQYDWLIIDTAGRTHIDDDMMREVVDIHAIAKADEVMFVGDAISGQDAVNSVRSFHKKLPLSAITLTRIDGDQRGGAALSLRHVTGCPIRFMGVGEKIDQLEAFHAQRIASRILGMGDIVSLVEKASDLIDEQTAEAMSQKMMGGGFDFNDMLKQMEMLDKMGGIGSLLGMMPGLGGLGNLGKLKQQADGADMSKLKRQRAMIQSMTAQERKQPNIIHASRKKRIIKGAGVSMSDLNKLLKQHEQMKKMMKKLGSQAGDMNMGDMPSNDMMPDNLPNMNSPLQGLANSPLGSGGFGLPPFKK